MIPLGNTPTGVGKTFLVDSYIVELKKHPHGRGEDMPRAAIKAGL